MQLSSSDYRALQHRVSEIEVELARLRGEVEVERIERGERVGSEATFDRIGSSAPYIPLSYKGIRSLRVRERINLIEELWKSIWDKSPSKWFPLTPLIRDELEKRCEDGRI
jgi:hypothetical protein